MKINTEFRRLNTAAQQALERSEALSAQQKEFIGNASHELQTPLAVLGGRIEWLLDTTSPDERTTGHRVNMQRTLERLVRLNRTLLLTKIDNGQFPDDSDVNLAAQLREQASLYGDIFADRRIRCTLSLPERFTVRMNESLASVLVSNLVRNAFSHSDCGSLLDIRLEAGTLSVINDGTHVLDASRIFERFYQGSKREGSTGLGLALVRAVCRCYGFGVEYRFEQGRHRFSVRLPNPPASD